MGIIYTSELRAAPYRWRTVLSPPRSRASFTHRTVTRKRTLTAT
jgi:hypothetical protein